jgi:hypothetical protein
MIRNSIDYSKIQYSKIKFEFRRAKWKNLFYENSTLNPCEVYF